MNKVNSQLVFLKSTISFLGQLVSFKGNLFLLANPNLSKTLGYQVILNKSDESVIFKGIEMVSSNAGLYSKLRTALQVSF